MKSDECRKKLKQFLKKCLSEEDAAKAMELAGDWVSEFEEEGVRDALCDY